MIKVLVNKKKIEMTGHSDYAEFGKDIVCSAASSIMTTSVNAIYKFNLKAISYRRDDMNDSSIIEIKSDDNITLTLIDNMVELLDDLSKQYPKDIIIEKER